MTTIRCRVSAEVKGTEPPANGAGRWLKLEGPGPFRRLYPSEEFERSFWGLMEEALLLEDALQDGAEAIAREAFGEERLLSAPVRRCDRQPTDEAKAKARSFLAQRGVIDAIEGKI